MTVLFVLLKASIFQHNTLFAFAMATYCMLVDTTEAGRMISPLFTILQSRSDVMCPLQVSFQNINICTNA